MYILQSAHRAVKSAYLFNNARAIAIRCRCPPDNNVPFPPPESAEPASPTIVIPADPAHILHPPTQSIGECDS